MKRNGLAFWRRAVQLRRALPLLLFWAHGLRVHEVDEGVRRREIIRRLHYLGAMLWEALEVSTMGIARIARSKGETEAIAGCGSNLS
jgi:hypothetical protein